MDDGLIASIDSPLSKEAADPPSVSALFRGGGGLILLFVSPEYHLHFLFLLAIILAPIHTPFSPLTFPLQLVFVATWLVIFVVVLPMISIAVSAVRASIRAFILTLPSRYRRIKSFIRVTILRLTPPPNIAIPEILSLITSHLPRSDLMTCCRVNQLFFEVASRRLYGSNEGLHPGKTLYYFPMDEVHTLMYIPNGHRDGRTVFQGTEPYKEPIIPPTILLLAFVEYARSCYPHKRWVWWLGSGMIRLSDPPVCPSRLKLQLLKHVRHLVYAADVPRKPKYDILDSRDMFPSLRTLTFHPVHDETIEWDLPFVSGLRPSHIRLSPLRMIPADPRRIHRLDSPVGYRAEKVTIHFIDCSARPALTRPILDIRWPRMMQRLDIVFAAPTPDATNRLGDPEIVSFAHAQPPLIPHIHRQGVAEHIAEIMVSAEHTTLLIRIIGLDGQREAKGDGAEEEAADFARMLEETYVRLLRFQGMSRDEATQRGERLEFVSWDDYRAERDTLPF